MVRSTAGEATLSSSGDMTSFAFGDHVIRFKTSPGLEHYDRVLQWDKGYIVCTAKYRFSDSPTEEYIDLVPILENLYFDPAAFLAPIRKVRVSYDG